MYNCIRKLKCYTVAFSMFKKAIEKSIDVTFYGLFSDWLQKKKRRKKKDFREWNKRLERIGSSPLIHLKWRGADPLFYKKQNCPRHWNDTFASGKIRDLLLSISLENLNGEDPFPAWKGSISAKKNMFLTLDYIGS